MFIYLPVCICLFIHSVIHSCTWDSLSHTIFQACLKFVITQAVLELTVDPVVIAPPPSDGRVSVNYHIRFEEEVQISTFITENDKTNTVYIYEQVGFLI